MESHVQQLIAGANHARFRLDKKGFYESFFLRANHPHKPQAFWMMLAVTTGPLLLASAYYQWHGGGCWGPRLLVPILPVALLPAGEVTFS